MLKETRSFSPKMGNKTRVSAFSTSAEIFKLGKLDNKVTQLGKKEITLSLFADDRSLPVVNSKSYTHTHAHVHTPVRTDTFSNVAEYKINTLKHQSHFCNCQWTSLKREIRKIILFTIASERIKYLEIILTEEVKDLHSKNCKTQLGEMKEDTNVRKDSPCSRAGRLSSVKVSMPPTPIHRVHAVPVKMPAVFPAGIEKSTLKFI